MAKKKTDNKAAESAKPSQSKATVPTSGPSETMKQMFAAGALSQVASVQGLNLERRNMPRLIKPEDIPIGGGMAGQIVKFVPSPKKEVKGDLVWLRLRGGVEITFPVTGVLRQALNQELDKEIGKVLIIIRGPDGHSKRFGGNKMFMFDVYTTDDLNALDKFGGG